MRIKHDNASGSWAGPLTSGDQWEIIQQVGSRREGGGLAWLSWGPRGGESGWNYQE